MKLTRRQLAQWGLVGLAGMSPFMVFGNQNTLGGPGLKILILGGTGFLGPHIVSNAVARGHTVTLFNRGKSDPHLFPDLEKIKGQRSGNLAALEGRKWDVVIDTSSFMPNEVQKSCALLKPNTGHYIYMSSTAVYKDWTKPDMTEDAPIYSMRDPESAEYGPFQKYGAAKGGSESQVRRIFKGQSTIIRSDPIVGPGDGHHRYTYWTRKAAEGGEILGPGKGSSYVQYIDARDLAQWIIHCAEKAHDGTFNASSSSGAYTIEELITDCQTVSEQPSSVVWVESDFLVAQGVQDIPFWTRDPEVMLGVGQLNVTKAAQHGLKQRPKIETAKDVYEWYQSFSEEEKQLGVGLSQARQAELIAAWKSRAPSS